MALCVLTGKNSLLLSTKFILKKKKDRAAKRK